MKRRDFLASGAAGTLGVGFAGCSAFGLKKIEINESIPTPIDLKTKVPKPTGTMPMGEIGTTGIKVSRFGFGAHMRSDMLKYVKEREWMIREAYDLGINLFDIYEYQYEPMGRYLAPIINDVVISIVMWTHEGRTVGQELERNLRLFGRDYIDMVRLDEKVFANQSGQGWEWWETLFKLKEKGYIRAVGIPIHNHDNIKEPLARLPLDFVILPFNFYHNWYRMQPYNFDSLIAELRRKGIGVLTMKPRLGDRLATPFKRIAEQLDKSDNVNYMKATLRYIINYGITFDSTLAGMFNPYHVYENVDAFYHPEMSDEERKLLKKVRNAAKINNVTKNLLPEHYRFLEEWVPDSWDDSDLYGAV